MLLGAVAARSDEAEEADVGSFAERPEEYPELVDEDEDFAPRQVYAFNPVQARKELKVGNYYAKKGSHRAAARRYLEATRWDSNLAEAYWRLGQAREKLDEADEATAAYARFLALEPDGSRARQIRRRLERLKRDAGRLPLAAKDQELPDAP